MNNRITKTMRAKAGFTLVELIVVIAILGILAGVGTVGYSGYIKKANMAADQQLLGYVNQAFAAACIEKNVDITDLRTQDVPITLDSDGKISNLTAPNVSFDDFQKYYGDNGNLAFKVMDDLYFDVVLLAINYANAERINVSFGDTTLTLSGADVEKLKNSAYSKNMAVDDLMSKIDLAVEVAAEVTDPNGALYKYVNGDDAKAFLCQTMGVSDYYGVMQKLVEMYPQEQGESEDNYNARMNDIEKKMLANNAVLFAARNSSDVKESTLEILLGDNAASNLAGKADADPANGLAQTAMAYGLYTSYIVRNGGTPSTDVDEVKRMLDNAEFKEYLSTPEAQDDIDGYLASMNMINNNVAADSEAVNAILFDGFANDDLIKLLSQLTGN